VFRISFASFLIFGGITFLIIGIRLILGARAPTDTLHPKVGQVSGSIAMPFIVGPGTISASVLAGTRLPLPTAMAAIGVALVTALLAIVLFKRLHDYVQHRNEGLIQRYVEVAGRVTALFTGSFAIEMILKGVESWIGQVR
jgi:multiple antibiotic resistance protein